MLTHFQLVWLLSDIQSLTLDSKCQTKNLQKWHSLINLFNLNCLKFQLVLIIN